MIRSAVADFKILALVSAVGTTACYRGIDPGAASDTEEGTVALSSTGGPEQPDLDSTGTPPDPLPDPEVPAQQGSPGVRMLTQREVHNSLRDLLGVTVPLEDIPAERVVDGHGHIASGQGIGLDEAEQFYELALDAAMAWSRDEPADCDVTELECASGVVLELLPRAFRGEVDEEDAQAYLDILSDPEAGPSTRARLETCVAAILSSPRFLYRTELGAEPVEERPGRFWLTDHEIAARLSFLLWQSGPDEALRQAANDGALRDPAERLAQLDRMMADPRAARGQVGFVSDWLGVTGRSTLDDKDPEVLAGTTTALRSSAEESFARTIEALMEDPDGAFSSLLTTDEYWVDAELAELLETAPVDDGFRLRSLEVNRRGMLMHPVLLAAHTKESGASPFTIGDFVADHLLCQQIAPPVELPGFDADEDPTATLRERLEALTEPAQCQFCHNVIGPPGFAFLGFDPIGRFAEADGLGRPFDTRGTVPVGASSVDFESAADLSTQLAAKDEVIRCLARRLYRWTYGHFESDLVLDEVEAVEHSAVATAAHVRTLFETVVESDTFAQVLRGE